MSDFIIETSWLVFRSTLFLSVAACLACIGVKLSRTNSPRTMTLVWSMVLFAGLCVVPAPLTIPWYEAPVASQIAVTGEVLRVSPPVAARTVAPSPPTAAPSVVEAVDDSRPEIPPKVTPSVNASDALPLIWFSGLAIIAVVSIIGYVGLLLTLRNSWDAPRWMRQEYEKAAVDAGIGTPPRLVVHESLGPMLCLTPRGHCLVVPSHQWSSLRPQQRDLVFKHELAHYVRHDVWWTLPLRLVVLLHWFNPLAWLAAHRVEESCEWAADRFALAGRPSGVGELASALVELAQSHQCSRLLASAARGRSLKKRLSHLIQQTETTGDEPMIRRASLVAMMSLVILAGAIQVRLVAQESTAPAPEATAAAATITVDVATDFANKLVGEDDLTLGLKEALQSDTGALVLRDRANYYEGTAKNDAIAEAIPRFFDEMFETSDSGLRLRSAQQSFREPFITKSQATTADIVAVKTRLAEMAERIDLDTDLNKIMYRFMTDDSAPVILYKRQLRDQMRPNANIIGRVFGTQFAKRRDGMMVIRPEAREIVEKRMQLHPQRVKMLDRIQTDLAEFSDEITPQDDFHIRFKKALKDPLVATRLSVAIFEGETINRRMVDNIVNQFEGTVREGPEGLILMDAARPRLERILPELERTRELAEALRAPMSDFVSMIAVDDDLHRHVRNVMASDLTLARIGARVPYLNSSVSSAVDMYFSSLLKEKENGRVEVNTTTLREEQVIGMVSAIFREARMARRKGREFAEFAEQVADDELREALLSPGGRASIGDELKKRYEADVAGGMSQWVLEHFVATDQGYAINPSKRGEIEAFIKQAAEAAQEFVENDDF